MKRESRSFSAPPAILALLIVVLLLPSGCSDPLSRTRVTETVSDAWIAVYFNSPRYPDDPASRTAGIDLNLVALIDSAQQSVDVAAYDIDLDTVADALIRAHNDNVSVRVVTDGTNADEDAITRIRQAQIPVVARPDDGWGIMHDKFVVVDDVWVWTGSWNLTENGTYRNNNNGVLIASRRVAQNYATEFEELFSGMFGPSSPADTPYPLVEVQTESSETLVEIYFAPEDNVAEHIIEAISQAHSQIRFMAFQFTSETIAEAMIDQAQNGIQVSGVVEERDANRSYSQYSYLNSNGVAVWTDGNPYIMHHKVIIIDDETVILGSYNFTGNAEENNDENVVIIHDPEVAAAFLAEFGRVSQQAMSQ